MTAALFAAAYLAVLTAELVGDKTLYSASALASRYSPTVVLAGMTPAFMAKMLAAVLLGDAISLLPSGALRAVTATTFFLTALVIWFRAPEAGTESVSGTRKSMTGAGAAFGAVFFSEWGDPGQIAAASLAAHYQEAGLVWSAGTLAMLTKGLLAVTLGMGLRRFLPQRVLRVGAASLCVALGIITAIWPERG